MHQAETKSETEYKSVFEGVGLGETTFDEDIAKVVERIEDSDRVTSDHLADFFKAAARRYERVILDEAFKGNPLPAAAREELNKTASIAESLRDWGTVDEQYIPAFEQAVDVFINSNRGLSDEKRGQLVVLGRSLSQS